MTGYTVHTGTSKKFTEGWDRIFTGKKKSAKKTKAAAGKSKSKKKK